MALTVDAADGSVAIRYDNRAMMVGEMSYPDIVQRVSTGSFSFFWIRKEIRFERFGINEITSMPIDHYP